MNATQISETLKACRLAGLPVYISGPPGVGKSQTVRQFAAEIGADLVDVRASLLDAVDLRGLPQIVDGITTWAPPGFLPADAGDGAPVVLFLDELPNAPQLVQAALLQLVLDRRLGEYSLPDNVFVVAAGNRVGDRAGASRLLSSLSSRLVMVDFETSLSAWMEWAFSAGIADEVIFFARFRPALLCAFDPKAETSPNPRAWERVSRLLPHLPRGPVEVEAYAGLVGEAAATEFVAFMGIWRDLPDPDGVLLMPETAEVPTDPATLYALTGALAAKAGKESADRLVRYAHRLPPEYAVLLVTESARKGGSDFMNTRAFVEWNVRNADLLTGTAA